MFSVTSATRSTTGSSHRGNQDVILIADRRFCVADGHGPLGRIVAETVCATVRAAPETDSFEDIFARADSDVSAIPDIRNVLSGATASLLTVGADGVCRVGHVGDSEVRYYDSDEGNGEPLTLDHSAMNPDEFHRIRALPVHAGCIFTGGPPWEPTRPVFVKRPEPSDEWILNPLGGFRYCNVRGEWSTYISHAGDNLAITRAIGDYNMRNSGLIATPSILTAAAPALGTTRAIVMASDGLWDCMHYGEIKDIVRNPECLGNAELAADRLLVAAKTQTAQHFGKHYDDISFIVIYLGPCVEVEC